MHILHITKIMLKALRHHLVVKTLPNLTLLHTHSCLLNIWLIFSLFQLLWEINWSDEHLFSLYFCLVEAKIYVPFGFISLWFIFQTEVWCWKCCFYYLEDILLLLFCFSYINKTHGVKLYLTYTHNKHNFSFNLPRHLKQWVTLFIFRPHSQETVRL